MTCLLACQAPSALVVDDSRSEMEIPKRSYAQPRTRHTQIVRAKGRVIYIYIDCLGRHNVHIFCTLAAAAHTLLLPLYVLHPVRARALKCKTAHSRSRAMATLFTILRAAFLLCSTGPFS